MRTFKGHRVKPHAPSPHRADRDGGLRTALWWSFAAIAVMMLAASPGFAISADEPIQNWYGHLVVKYFATLGKDKSALTTFGNMCWYGGMYDGICALVARFSPYEIYDTRHFLNALSGFGVIWFAARLGKIYGGYTVAIAVAWMLFLSPRLFGDAMNNPKDVPFALGMTAGLFAIVKFLQAGPRPDLRQCAWMAAGIAFAMNIRIGGLLLVPYLCLFAVAQWWAVWRHTEIRTVKQFARYAGILAAVCIAGWLGGVLFWPYGLQNPLINPLKALKLMSNAYIGATVLFDGQDYPTWQVPPRYLPQYIAVTTPLLIVISAALSPLLLFRGTPSHKRKLLVLFFAVIFPIAYIIFNRSPLYDAWRHVLFIYPPLVVLAALVLVQVAAAIRQRWARALLWAGFAATFIPVGAWMIRSHPMQLVYYNELVGGIRGAFGRYETDYYAAGMEEACERFAKEARLDQRTDTVRLATNFWGNMTMYYLRRYGGRIKYIRTPYEDRYDYNWDYAIYRSRGVDCYLLQNGYYPPKPRRDAVTVDGVVMYAILQADPAARARTNALAAAIRDSAWSSAVPLAEEIIRTQPHNETVYPRYALALLRSGRRDEAWKQIHRMLRINQLDERARRLYKEMSGKEHPRKLPITPAPRGWRTVLSDQ